MKQKQDTKWKMWDSYNGDVKGPTNWNYQIVSKQNENEKIKTFTYASLKENNVYGKT